MQQTENLWPIEALADLPPEIRERFPIAMERASAKAAGAKPPKASVPLLTAAEKARTRAQRVIWLQRWASAWVQPLVDQAPCRAGCDHCCHIPVVITSAEARQLARATGRSLSAPAGIPCDSTDVAHAQDWQAQQEARWVGTPCPFLKNSTCSVYEHRPFACRTHVTLDDDNLLCRLRPGQTVPMPYANTRRIWALFLGLQPGEILADVREFFAANGCNTVKGFTAEEIKRRPPTMP